MGYWFLYGYEAAVLFIPFFCIFRFRRHRALKRGEGQAPVFCLAVFAVYLWGVFHVTEPGTLFDFLRNPWEFRADFINLIPFSDPDLNRVACRLNVLLFIPFGFLLPLGWPGYRQVKNTAFLGFGFSLLIELSQLLNNRRTDVDDLLLNTLGAAIGYFGFRLFRHFRKGREADGGSMMEPVLYIAVLFVFRFFAYNEFGAAKWLFGF